MNTISAEEIKRRGISAADETLKEGPVYVIKNNRPQYVILTKEQYAKLTACQAKENNLWDWLERPPRGSCSTEAIDAYLQEQRECWGSRR
jgi:hypothetical protein